LLCEPQQLAAKCGGIRRGTDVVKALWLGDGSNVVLAWRVAADVKV